MRRAVRCAIECFPPVGRKQSRAAVVRHPLLEILLQLDQAISEPACRCVEYCGRRGRRPRWLRGASELVPGLRFHDLRHTVITELLEAGEPDHVVESITGHLSRRMLEHYSHIRIDAIAALEAAHDAVSDRAHSSRISDLRAHIPPLKG
ncbi:MAG: tyrosine-type recombinase/integrase [Vicinamibacterales bacterium]